MITEIVDPDSLRLHPLLAQQPPPDSEILTSVTDDIAERGIDHPLIVDEKNRVMDGRIRLRGALALELPEIEIVRRPSSEAATIIIQSLLQRRHFSKSALAYLTYPLFGSMLEESKARRVENLKRGGASPDSTQNVLSGRSAELVARQAGVSRALFFQAREVHKLFARHPEAKEKLEPQILAGDLCLGYAINGVVGLVSTKGKARNEENQLELFQRGIVSLRHRFTKWEQLAPKMRLLIANDFAEAIAEAPEEVQKAVRATLLVRKAAAR